MRHRALPERRLEDVSLQTSLAGYELGVPLLISAMTGGTPEAQELNRSLMNAAAAHGAGFVFGSGRALLSDPSLLATYRPAGADRPPLLRVAAVGAAFADWRARLRDRPPAATRRSRRSRHPGTRRHRAPAADRHVAGRRRRGGRALSGASAMRVAVIGSGLGGLAAALRLQSAGAAVTVLDYSPCGDLEARHPSRLENPAHPSAAHQGGDGSRQQIL
jgi:hypothetical protein